MQCKLIYGERKQINRFLRMRWEEERVDERDLQRMETIRDDRYIYYLDYGGGFMSVYVFQILSNDALKMCSLFYHLYLNKAEKV